jgi:hypothetical protein
VTAVALAGCGGGGEAGGISREEAQQLNEAAEMLDASPDSLVANDDAMLGNGDTAVASEAPAEDDRAATDTAR